MSSIKSTISYSKGFTLIELIATMVLIGILAVSVAPKFIGPSSYQAYAVRSELISYLRKTQLRAMNNSDRCYRFSASSNGYQTLVGIKNNNGSCNSYGDPLPLNSWPNEVEVISNLFINNPTTFYFDFASSGGLIISGTFSQDVFITIRAEDTTQIQISQQGYIHGI